MLKLPFTVDLSGKVAVVTGAGGVLCSVFAQALAQCGAKVALLDINREAAEGAAAEIAAQGLAAKGYACNVLDKQSCLDAREQIRQRLATGESLYYDDWPRRLSTDFSPDRFYLTEGDRLAFFYPLYTLAPYAEGLPVFSIPCPISLSCEKEENSGPKNCKKNQ